MYLYGGRLPVDGEAGGSDPFFSYLTPIQIRAPRERNNRAKHCLKVGVDSDCFVHSDRSICTLSPGGCEAFAYL
jgi:hypothetical protein